MEKVNIGIIGCGRIAQDQTASAIQLKNTRVAAVCDKNKEAAETFAKKFGIPKVYTEYEKMLSDPEIQAVYNCTPNFLHAKVAIDAARAKKHVLTQKPFANTLEEANEICKAAEANKIILQAAFFERFRGYCAGIKRCIDEGKIGEVLMIKAQMSHEGIGKFYHPRTEWFSDTKLAGGGCLADMGAHHLDLMRWFAGSEVDIIDAQIGFSKDWKTETNAIVNMTFKNGVMAQGHWSFSTIAPDGVCYDKFEIYGDKGTIFVTCDSKEEPSIRLVQKGDNHWNEYAYEEVDGFYGMEEHFANCILEDKTPITSGKDGICSVKTILAAYESARTGQRQKL